jgi:hypothetical protein
VKHSARKLEASIELMLTVLLALIPIGRAEMGFPPNIPLGIICWGLSALAVARMFWIYEKTYEWPLWMKIPLVIVWLLVTGYFIVTEAQEAYAIRVKEKPDLAIRIVNPKTPGIVILPPHVVARDAEADPLLWDLDLPSADDSLFVNKTKYDWIRPDQKGGPTSLLHPHDIESTVKPGHRIFGFVTVTCPECLRVNAYWVYFTYGQTGWYAKTLPGQVPDPGKIADSLPLMRRDPEKILAHIPESTRINITDEP